MAERGVIRNREFKQQIADFSGLRWGKVTPTDLDGFIDFGNKLFVFIESKHGDSVMPYGQRLALERLCDACHKPPLRYAVGFVVSQWSSGDIDMAQTTVTAIRWEGKWSPPKAANSALVDGIEAFRKRFTNSNVVPFVKPEPKDEWLSAYERIEGG